MGLPEREALADQIVGGFSCEQYRARSSGPETVFAKFRAGDRASGNGEHIGDLIVRGEEGFFVLLQIALITGGQTFQRGEQADEGTRDAAAFAAD